MPVVEDIVVLGKSMALEMDDDVKELMEDHNMSQPPRNSKIFRGAATDIS